MISSKFKRDADKIMDVEIALSEQSSFENFSFIPLTEPE
jgi:hypothetical protein